MLSKKIAQAVSNAVKGRQGADARPRRGMSLIAAMKKGK